MGAEATDFLDAEEIIHHLFCAIEDIGNLLVHNEPNEAFKIVEREMGDYCLECHVFGCSDHGKN